MSNCTSTGTMEDKRNIQIIEWEHLDKKKFYVFGVAMTMMIRVSVYPFTLIRTRLQVQKGKSLYHGTFDAFIKILRADGVTGLYRGFLVNTFTLISGQCYVTTYELTRKFVADYSQSNTVKSLVAGGSASLVAQSITVPIDVVSQHLMMQRKGEKMGRFQVRGNPEGQRVVAFGQTKDIIRQILRADGLRGFYRGYVASLLTYIPNSAVWWPFYHFYAVKTSGLAMASRPQRTCLSGCICCSCSHSFCRQTAAAGALQSSSHTCVLRSALTLFFKPSQGPWLQPLPPSSPILWMSSEPACRLKARAPSS
ncbi:solute carrier family 25 member 44 isoform 3-T3 [Dugong dugon]